MLEEMPVIAIESMFARMMAENAIRRIVEAHLLTMYVAVGDADHAYSEIFFSSSRCVNSILDCSAVVLKKGVVAWSLRCQVPHRCESLDNVLVFTISSSVN